MSAKQDKPRRPKDDRKGDPYVEKADANPERRNNGCMVYRVNDSTRPDDERPDSSAARYARGPGAPLTADEASSAWAAARGRGVSTRPDDSSSSRIYRVGNRG